VLFRSARTMSSFVLENNLTASEFGKVFDGAGISDMILTAEILAGVPPGRLKEFSYIQVESGHYTLFAGVRHENGVQGYFLRGLNGRIVRSSESTNKSEFVAGAKRTVDQLLAEVPQKRGKGSVKFNIYSKRGSPGKAFVGKKIGARKYIDLKTFDSSKEAFQYVRDHHDELVALLAGRKKIPEIRREVNNLRTGKDHRGGRDIDAVEFVETFGFRGVEFGNYVEQTKRQEDLNDAYDGFMDLVEILDIPPAAVSLNGKLGMAFGARGRGAAGRLVAAAHFEPTFVVINLTKRSGAGSLAHEWWHALDNYFGRQHSNVDDAFLSTDAGQSRFIHQQNVRGVVVDAYKEVRKAIKQSGMADRSAVLDGRRSSPYYSTTIELTARAFERFVIDKASAAGYESDYLANIESEEVFNAAERLFGNDSRPSYPYPTDVEAKKINKTYQALFNTLQVRGIGSAELFALEKNSQSGENKLTKGSAFLLEKRLQALGLSDKVSVALVEALETGSGTKALGRYTKRLIEISQSANDGTYVLNHEAVHALREMGLFSEKEWKILERAAQSNKSLMADTRTVYGEQGLTEEQITEEAVAEMYAAWAKGKAGQSVIGRLFARVKSFFNAIRTFASARAPSSESVLQSIESGEVGSRAAIDEPGPMGISERFALSRDTLDVGGAKLPPIRTKASVAAGARPPETPVSFENDETEDRWQDARKGIAGQTTLLDRIKEGLERIENGFTRHFQFLPNEARFSDVREQLRKLEAAPQANKEKVLRILRDLTEGMTSADLDLFTRKVVLDDLSWEVEQDHALPFGLTQASVPIELRKIDEALAERPDLIARVRRRKMVVTAVANQLVEAGVLHREQIKNPAYYRHQVLDYARGVVAELRVKGGGKRVRSPYWASRSGSSLDINANLLEAEFEWLQKAMTDVSTAGTIEWVRDSEHNLRDGLVAEAREANQEALDKAAENNEEIAAALKDFKKQIAIGFSGLKKALKGDGFPDLPSDMEAAADALRSDNGSGDVFPLLAWVMDNDLPGAKSAAQIYKAITGRRSFTREVLGNTYTDPGNIQQVVKRFAPEGYKTWQPEEGKLLFTSKTLPEHVLDRVATMIMDGTSFPPEMRQAATEAFRAQVRDVLTVGGEKYTMVLPEEIADTLNSINDTHSDNLISFLFSRVTGEWKRWVLINPRRVLKYNLNNMSGDLDAVIAGNPSALKKMPQAIGELWRVMFKGAKPSKTYADAIERGVFDSGWSIQEVPGINDLDGFRHLLDRPKGIRGAARFALSPVHAVWKNLQKFTWFRENWLRYAAYLDYIERLEAGKTMEEIGYGAGLPKMVDAVADPKDKAALLARELVGDYGAVSHYGSHIRQNLIPFYSWMEINTKRYWRFGGNAYRQGIGKGLATSGYLAASLGVRTTAWLAIRSTMIYASVVLWNNLVFPDDEEALSEMDRIRMHVNLGRTDDGEIRTIRFQGALSDFLGWVGFNDAVAVIGEMEKGRADWTDLLATIAKAPFNRVGSSLTPVLSLPIETLAGRKFWPDIFEPRVIRDRWRNAAQLFSIENEYDLAFGRPSRGFGSSLASALVSSRDVGEIAYNETRGRAFEWVREARGTSGSSSFSSPRSDALYDYRRSLRFGDKEAAAAALQRMQALGMRRRDVRNSIKRAHPLGPVALRDRRVFVGSLTARERTQLNTAIEWYSETFR